MKLPEYSSTAIGDIAEGIVEEPSYIVLENDNSLPSKEGTATIISHREVILKIENLQHPLEKESVYASLRLEKARELMRKLTPIKIELKEGTIKKLDRDLIAEKTTNGKIILYEVVP